MITFILLGAGFIIVLALVAVAWGANNRKRKNQAEIPAQTTSSSERMQSRATPPVE